MSADNETVFKKLVSGPDDVVGALAYALYKVEKLAFMEHIGTEADGKRPPTSEECRAFHVNAVSAPVIAGYRERGATLAEKFLQIALETKLLQAQTEMRQDATMEEVKGANRVVEEKLATILTHISYKRGFWGWLRDIGTNMVTSFGTILLIGALIAGYKYSSAFTGQVEKVSGLSTEEPKASSAPQAQAAKTDTSAPK
ncbi:hypothetical protein ACPRNU_21465 [Chromobacterium vaccinii]|uniref:hypothetical protein n=1 Tax=Chromobacterium vaccinii TaxID=1108595 RepID=UPI003C71C33F